MSDILLNPDLLPYWVAAGVLVGLIVVESLSMLAGAPASAHLDHAIATEAAPDLAHDAGHAADHDSEASVLGWLNIGRVPLLVLIMMLLGAFAAIGFASVLLMRHIGLPAPWIVTAPIAAIFSVIVSRGTTRIIARILPRDETYATGPDEWVGATAEITLGPARAGVVAIARLKDRFGNLHFPRVEPLHPGTEIAQGSIVLVVERRSGVLLVVPAEGRLAEAP